MTPDDVAEQIIALFRRRGDDLYGGEQVSQTEHAVQCAMAADQAGAPDPLVVATLLHDVGHLLQSVGEDAAERGIDAVHEQLGAEWLAMWFGPEVTEPIRLHVPAKRYLCAVEPAYLAGLSQASLTSLRVQGGPMSVKEQAAFKGVPFCAEAVMLRRFDDVGKLKGMPIGSIADYHDRIAAQVCRV